MRRHSSALVALCLSCTPNGAATPPSRPPHATNQPSSPAFDAETIPTARVLPTPPLDRAPNDRARRSDRSSFVETSADVVGLRLRVPPSITVEAYDDPGNAKGILLSHSDTDPQTPKYQVVLRPAYAFERDELTVSARKRWLFEDSLRKDVRILFESDDALLYEHREEGLLVCEVFAAKDIGDDRWVLELSNPVISYDEAGKRTVFHLPETACFDAVEIVRSLERQGTPS